MNYNETLDDPEMGATEFGILRKTWTQEDGIPQLVDMEEIFAFGIIHPADPALLDLTPEEGQHDPIILIHSTEPLSLGETRGETWVAPDEIIWGDRMFRVFQVRPWQAFGFWKSWAVEIV